jgi:hypothetical protein
LGDLKVLGEMCDSDHQYTPLAINSALYECQLKSDPPDSLKVTHLDRLCHNAILKKWPF